MSDFKTYAVCPCGHREIAPFGSKFHVHVWVCPKCGTDKDDWRIVVGRVVNVGSWWRPDHRFVEREEHNTGTSHHS